MLGIVIESGNSIDGDEISKNNDTTADDVIYDDKENT